ncbi:MAG: LytTR family transcriptional regulator [Gemmatimonadota bacterium]|nr:MAG: LytTR family transcriptional regulator [Gemmatimonadota bacterium]
MRIRRPAIVNIDRVAELHPVFHGEYVLILSTGKRLEVTRGYRDQLAIALGTAL